MSNSESVCTLPSVSQWICVYITVNVTVHLCIHYSLCHSESVCTFQWMSQWICVYITVNVTVNLCVYSSECHSESVCTLLSMSGVNWWSDSSSPTQPGASVIRWTCRITGWESSRGAEREWQSVGEGRLSVLLSRDIIYTACHHYDWLIVADMYLFVTVTRQEALTVCYFQQPWSFPVICCLTKVPSVFCHLQFSVRKVVSDSRQWKLRSWCIS